MIMKKYIIFPLLVLLAIACNKNIIPDVEPQEIVLGVGDGFDAIVETKATAVTSLPSSLYWGATSGSIGSTTSSSLEKTKWSAASASVSSNKIATGKYQTKTATAYNYYVANKTFTITDGTTSAAGTVIITTDNSTDVIAGKVAASTSNTPSVTLSHIFARTGSLSLSAGTTGYTLSNISWKIVGKSTINGTAGTYNVGTGTWASATTKLTTETALTNSSDMYLIPGTYTLKVTYTATVGDYSTTETKTQDIILTGGKINNISGTISLSPRTPISISVTLTAWDSVTINKNANNENLVF